MQQKQFNQYYWHIVIHELIHEKLHILFCETSRYILLRNSDVFRMQSNIYDGIFLGKQFMATVFAKRSNVDVHLLPKYASISCFKHDAGLTQKCWAYF